MATSCIKVQYVKVSYELSPCPSPEFTLPLTGFDQNVIGFEGIDGTTDYEFKKFSNRKKTGWISPFFQTYIEKKEKCFFHVLMNVSDASKGKNLSASDTKAIIEKNIQDINVFAATIFLKSKTKTIYPGSIEFISWNDVRKIEKALRPKVTE